MSQWRVQLFHSGAGRAEDPTVVSDFRNSLLVEYELLYKCDEK